MAGVGKTTLALTLCKTPSMADHFDMLAWCTVSQSYRTRDLFHAILDQVDSLDKSYKSISEDQELADHFWRSLRKRSYLIVLDDIWDTTLWDYLKRYLPNDDRNRILITTRNKDIADQIGSTMNELCGLSDTKSWELFQKKMLGIESLSNNLLNISERIVQSCQRLPLSIVIIAGVLSDLERTEENWNEIAKSVSSVVMSDPQGNCRAILELSYNRLHNHLKSCFLYLGSFSEDEEISVKQVIKLWIGEGLVRDTTSDRAEEVARKYIEILIEKNLIIPTLKRSQRGVKRFRLHDLLRDFCFEEAKEKHFFSVLDGTNSSRSLQDPRRLFINTYAVKVLPFSCHSIRSMICYYSKTSEIVKKIQSCDMVLLKVLRAGAGDHSSSFEGNISCLVHLRYMQLNLKKFPSSISNLQNLEILILKFVYDTVEVPDLIWDMVKLRHVCISAISVVIEVDDKRLENPSSYLLENLTSLSMVHVSYDDSKWLSKFPRLQELSCVFRRVADNLFVKEFQKLSFNDHLTSLKVINGGSSYRRISTCQFPNNLRKLSLAQFYLKSEDISTIGTTLKHLEVFTMQNLIYDDKDEWKLGNDEWNVGNDEFPALKVLKLRWLHIRKWNASEDSFRSLEQLLMEGCQYLDEIPLEFGSLPNLRLIAMEGCSTSVVDSAKEIEKEQHEAQNTEMVAKQGFQRNREVP